MASLLKFASRRQESASLLATGFAIVLASSASSAWGQCEVAKLLDADGAAGDDFGQSVAASADVVILGARKDDGLISEDTGSASIYRYDPDTSQWGIEGKLVASDALEGEWFGGFVAICQDIAVVGATKDFDNGTNSGSAYVFRYNGRKWVEEAKLLASDGQAGALFGSVAISGNVVIVGAQRDNEGGLDTGSAYVFRFDPKTSQWVEEAKLVASDGSQADWFGRAVAISGDIVIVGSFHDDDACPGDIWCNSGSAYIYRYRPDTALWVQEAKLVASDTAYGDIFGKSVAISGDVVIIGTSGDGNVPGSGSAYVFRFDPATSIWVEEVELVASDGDAPGFGVSVSLSGDVALVGDSSHHGNGSAYVYRFDADTSKWVEQAQLRASDGSQSDKFGFSVAISDEILVVGAYKDDDNGTNSGSGYVFDLNPTPGDINCDGSVGASDLLILLFAWGSCTYCQDCDADLNGDCSVGAADLLILLANWG